MRCLRNLFLFVFVTTVIFGSRGYCSPLSHNKSVYASWYSTDDQEGTKTASGIPLDNEKMTAAHPSLPFGSLVRVTNLETSQTVIVEIIDRGPYVRKKRRRVIDLTQSAFEKIAPLEQGVVPIRIEVIVYATIPKKNRQI